MNRDFLTLGFGICAILLATQAGHGHAQQSGCAERSLIVSRLANDYGETRQAIGLAGPDQVVELFASLDSGTWTIMVTTPAGISCLVAAGENFERIEAAPVPLGDPA